MVHLSIGQRVIVGFAVVMLIALSMGIFAFSRLSHIELQWTRLQTDSVPGLHALAYVGTGTVERYAVVERYLRAADATEKAAAIRDMQTNQATMDERLSVYEATVFDPKERELYNAIKEARALFEHALRQVLSLGQEQKNSEALTVLNTTLIPAYQKWMAAVHADLDFNASNSEQAIKGIEEASESTKTSLLLGTVVGLVISLLTAFAVRRAIKQPLAQLVAAIKRLGKGDFTQRLTLARRDEFGLLSDGLERMTNDLSNLVSDVQRSGIQLNTSATEIAATARQQQATASEVAATTTEIGASSQEISATGKELVTTMHEVTAVAEHTASLAGSGRAGLSRMEETMRHVVEAAGSINARLAVLNEKAGSINHVVTTITKVADQTNLLSLNAAIEAEKAGEYGRGFAVVATEIRRLADQTAVATYDIEHIVKDMQSAVAAGVMGMDKFSEEVRRGVYEVQQVSAQLAQIIQPVQTLTPRFGTVNEGMQAQVTGAEQISEALTQLSEATQQTVESLRQSTVVIEQLHEAAGVLRTGVVRFKLHG